jgi:hypothetical protein
MLPVEIRLEAVPTTPPITVSEHVESTDHQSAYFIEVSDDDDDVNVDEDEEDISVAREVGSSVNSMKFNSTKRQRLCADSGISNDFIYSPQVITRHSATKLRMSSFTQIFKRDYESPLRNRMSASISHCIALVQLPEEPDKETSEEFSNCGAHANLMNIASGENEVISTPMKFSLPISQPQKLKDEEKEDRRSIVYWLDFFVTMSKMYDRGNKVNGEWINRHSDIDDFVYKYKERRNPYVDLIKLYQCKLDEL